jgi:hypothetical protein
MAFNRPSFSKTLSGFIKNTNTHFLKRAKRILFSPNSGFSGALETFLNENLKKQALLGVYGYKYGCFLIFWVFLGNNLGNEYRKPKNYAGNTFPDL